eukprot:m.1308732 g.1308732  ORF g.1308732 m.1308732 type:complete len:53 (+) comp24820_c0_seq24:227-385(+)
MACKSLHGSANSHLRTSHPQAATVRREKGELQRTAVNAQQAAMEKLAHLYPA